MEVTNEELLSDESIVEEEFQSTLDENVIKLKYSHGYDSKRLYNMVLIDDDTLVFASGTYIHYFQISTRKVSFRESVFGCGIGFITKNYHEEFQGQLTIGENGPQATVFVYEYPSHNVLVKLQGAAKQQFTCGSYNFTGDLFASQAGYPDFMLTIWRWQTAEIILRSKAFQNDVLYVHFSKFNPILLVSCGLSHIKFWKMANTFTGLKLQGDLGRFGKTDFSDIYAVYMLADENVISSCEWGNMLLWEAGLVKFEITRKGRLPCHTKPIVRITMDNGELTTVGMDGYVRIWVWETVDVADPPDDDRFVEIEPMYEFYVNDCEIRMIQKIKLFDKKDYGYYILDGNGGIWYCDLNTEDIPKQPYKIYSFHGGKIVRAAVSPVSNHFLTIGEDRKISLYHFEDEKLLLQAEMLSICTDIIWLSKTLSPSGMEVLISFADGVLRQFYVDLLSEESPALNLNRVIKGHSKSITRMTVNPSNTLLVTGGLDRLIFVYKLSQKNEPLGLVHIHPIGFVELKHIPYSFNWKDSKFQIVIGCKTGEVYECRLPQKVTDESTFLSYNITDQALIKTTKFVSMKAVIRRDLKRAATKKRKDKKRKRKLKNIEKLKAANPGLQIDMEQALADSEPDEEEDALYIPPVPNPILWLRYTNRDTIWVSMAGYDAGYIYELEIGAAKPVYATIIKDGDDCEIHSYLDVQDYLIFGLINGKLRVNKINPENFTDLKNYRLFNYHDPLNGCITSVLLNYDSKYLLSVGHDGNIFVYNWYGPELVKYEGVIVYPERILKVKDIEGVGYPSLEQEKINADRKRKEDAAAAHDRKVLAEIQVLQEKFNKIMQENLEMDEGLQIHHKDMLLDQRITNEIKSQFEFQLNDVRLDLAYDLEVAQVGKQKLYDYFIKSLDHVPITICSVNSNKSISTFRVEILDEDFEKLKTEVDERLRLEALKRITTYLEPSEEKDESIPEPPEETFFFGRDPKTIMLRFSKKMIRLLNSYRSRQLYEVERQFHRGKMERRKPDPDKNHPDDDRLIEEAERNIGDYKLKTGAEYEPKPHETVSYKYKEILQLRERLYEVQTNYNKRVFQLRAEKKILYDKIEKCKNRLNEIHQYLPDASKRFLKDIKPINQSEEYPELNLIEHNVPGCGIEIKDILYLDKGVEDFLPKERACEYTAINAPLLMEMEVAKGLMVHDLPPMLEGETLIDEIKKYRRISTMNGGAPTEKSLSSLVSEIRYTWFLDLQLEQQNIIEEIEHGIRCFDMSLNQLANDKLEVQFESEFITTYLTALNQELYILRDSEQIENQLLSNAEAALKTRNQAQTSINLLTRQIDDLRKLCDRLNDQILLIQARFMTNCKNHKFFDFLRRIFKKKWRPPKQPKGEDESSESSSDESSSEEEEDTKSIDSTDMTAIRLDETHCPAGLERTTYELAFKLRADRHEMERGIIEALKQIDRKRDEIKEAQKNVKYHTDVYNQEKETLLTFRRKRQQELNKIQISIILQMHQIQHFRQDEDFRDLSKSILFDSACLINLRSRVDELKTETLKTKRLYRINVVHLRRMNADIKYMRSEILRLESLIREEMMKKFGVIVNLDELEEEVLRKYVFDLETSAEDEMRLIEIETKRKLEELALAQEELIRETQANCEKNNILTVLIEEKTHLQRVLSQQQANYPKWLKLPSLAVDRDIEKLLTVHKQQKETIERLEREICTLRVKVRPLQLDHQIEEESVTVAQEVLPKDDYNVCGEIFKPTAYQCRLLPDDFMIERCQNIVRKFFLKFFTKEINSDTLRRYMYKVSRYLAQVAYTFEGEVTEDIMQCIIDSIQGMIPKKYLMCLTKEDFQQLFHNVLNLFDYERVALDNAEVIGGFFENAKESLKATSGVVNSVQFLLLHVFKELVEHLTTDDLFSEKTAIIIVENLEKEPYFDGRCINVEGLVEKISKYAKENLLDNVTVIPIRSLANKIQEIYLARHPSKLFTTDCNLSVTLNKKRKPSYMK